MATVTLPGEECGQRWGLCLLWSRGHKCNKQGKHVIHRCECGATQ
jgi:hypothetical protein